MSAPRAFLGVRPDVNHPLNQPFIAGLKAAGYSVQMHLPAEKPGLGDVLVIWNRYADKEQTADLWERQGGVVLVAENGYCGRDAQGRKNFALSRHGHNGSGDWVAGGPERWAGMGIDTKPWRANGEHILVAPNRHFGMKGLAMPYGWKDGVLAQLRRFTKRPIRVREHPGNEEPKVPLAQDLERAHAVVIWASSVGVHALLAGIPVICLSPWWICKSAAGAHLAEIESPPMPDRRLSFERLAWAQWSHDEIASGQPFRRLVGEPSLAAA